MDTDEAQLDAGPFSAWLSGVREALDGMGESDVPCGDCTACCTSSQFIHVAPDETATRARIPAALLFPAPGLPEGHHVMGYDEQGHCPMFVDGACSIYADRPRTCRTYDCRVFPAADVDPGVDLLPLISARARRWRFSYPDQRDRVAHDAVEAAAAFLAEPGDGSPHDLGSANPTQRAVQAVQVHDLFLTEDADGGAHLVTPDREAVTHRMQQGRPGGRP